MKKIFLSLIFALIVMSSVKAPDYCDVYFSAYSIKRGVKCKYCDERKSFIIPEKIKFNRTLVCESFKDINNASEEGKCKLITIMHYLTSMYWEAWSASNSLASEKCLGVENPENTHKVYETEIKDAGLIEYGTTSRDLEKIMKIIDNSKNYIDYGSYNYGRKVSAQYMLNVIQNSCNIRVELR